MRTYLSIVNKIDAIIIFLIKVLTAVLISAVVMQVFCRVTSLISLPWLEELARYTLVWITFLGSSIAVRKGTLMNVDAFLKIIPKKLAFVLGLIGNIFSLIFIIVVIICGIQLMQLGMIQTAPASQVKMVYVFTALPVGGLFMLLNFFARIFDNKEE